MSAAKRMTAFLATAVLAAAVLLLSIQPLGAEPARFDEGVRVMVSASGEGRAADASSLAAALARSPALNAILQAPAGMELVEAAARARCGVAVDVRGLAVDGGQARSDWRVIDPFDGAVVAAGSIEGIMPTERDLADFWWLPVVEAVENALPSLRKTMVGIRAEPGTVVRGLSEQPLVISGTGRAELPLRVPGTYPWRSTAQGAYPERGVFDAFEHGAELAIPRRPLRRWSVELGMHMMQYPDLYGSWRFAGDALFLRFGASQFLAGIYLGDATSDSSDWGFVSSPLLQPGTGLGAYLLPPDYLFRPYLAVFAFARVIVAADLPLRLDPVGPFGSSAAVGAEWAIAERFSMFIELGASFYPCPDGALFASTRGSDSGGLTMSYYGDAWYFELPLFRFGVRMTL